MGNTYLLQYRLGWFSHILSHTLAVGNCKYQGCLTRNNTCYAHVLSNRRFWRVCRSSRTRYSAFCIGNRHTYCLTLLLDRGLSHEYESGGDLVHGLFHQPTTHGNPEYDQLLGERLTERGEKDSVRFASGILTEVSTRVKNQDSTQNVTQTKPKAKIVGLFRAEVTTKPMPRMEKGAADSMSIAEMLVYMLDVAEESTSVKSARMRRRRKQIIEVRMMFRLTLSETHGTVSWTGFPFHKDVLGTAHSTSATIEKTKNKMRVAKARTEKNEPLHVMNGTVT
jgi:hypothetical protein